MGQLRRSALLAGFIVRRRMAYPKVSITDTATHISFRKCQECIILKNPLENKLRVINKRGSATTKYSCSRDWRLRFLDFFLNTDGFGFQILMLAVRCVRLKMLLLLLQ